MKNKNKIIIGSVISIIIIADCILGSLLFARGNQKAVFLEASEIQNVQPLVAVDSNAKRNLIKKEGYATFNFTDEQRICINQSFAKNQSAALVLRVQVSLSDDQKASYIANKEYAFEFGFISDKNKSLVIKADANAIYKLGSDASKGVIDLSLAFEKSNSGNIAIPEGFFVYSSLQCQILNAYIAPVLIGFDKSTEIPFYGFSSNGGVLKLNSDTVDFTGASLVFPSQNTRDAYMPELVLKLSDRREHVSKIDTSVFVKLNINGENINVKNVSKGSELIIPCAAFTTPFSKIAITENSVCVKSMLMRSFTNVHNCRIDEQAGTDIFVPIRTDPGLILKWNVNNWRNVDYELFEWDRFPGIIYFDTRNYTVQDNFFRRLAFFAEKEGYKGRLLTNEELGTMHGFNALDYRPETLADFFNKATDDGFKLNKEEELLKTILIKNGLLVKDGNKVKPGVGGLVSISQESYAALRVQLMAHEAWHTLFFADEEFRNYVAAVYYTMDPQSLEFLIDYFRSQPSLGYDVNDDYLMKNEFMAYIMQQPVSGCGQYFVNHAWWNSVMAFTPDLANYVINTKGKGFEDAANALNEFVFDNYGLIAGNVSLVQRP